MNEELQKIRLMVGRFFYYKYSTVKKKKFKKCQVLSVLD